MWRSYTMVFNLIHHVCRHFFQVDVFFIIYMLITDITNWPHKKTIKIYFNYFNDILFQSQTI